MYAQGVQARCENNILTGNRYISLLSSLSSASNSIPIIDECRVVARCRLAALSSEVFRPSIQNKLEKKRVFHLVTSSRAQAPTICEEISQLAVDALSLLATDN